MYTANGHYKSVVIALWLGKGPGIVVLLRKQSWRKGEKESGPWSPVQRLFVVLMLNIAGSNLSGEWVEG